MPHETPLWVGWFRKRVYGGRGPWYPVTGPCEREQAERELADHRSDDFDGTRLILELNIFPVADHTFPLVAWGLGDGRDD